MDTSWWPALGAVVVLLALVAAVADGRGRLGPRRKGAADAARAARAHGAPLPRPGEVWRTSLPDGQERLFLVLAVRGDSARLARLTSEPSPDPVLPPQDPSGPAYLAADGLAEAGLARLLERVGEVDARTWENVRHLAE
ncbi:type II toxin-antitoxin system PemK/MazF family toxin [Streptomyces axinellae]|uniref:Secreted protein n=1 Tax=Streptomyces axinellae TaxID=552788 RepID=A0ABN3Q542_9ACTN